MPRAPGPAKPKVLIVEDDPDARRVMQLAVGAGGYQAILAADGVSALQAAKRENPAAIVLDLGLPGGDGFSVLERLAAASTLSAIPVVVVSGKDSARARALAGGAVAFLGKPIDGAALLGAIARVVSSAGATPAAAAVEESKVLIIEDDADLRHVLSLRLRTKGIQVVTAADASSAMTVAVRERPQAVILDLGLPGGDGMVLLERLKKNPQLAGVPVVVLSARDASSHREAALARGAVAYVQKPFDDQALMDTILSALGVGS
jgi:DNA-binding response OmpR family regulator